MATVSAVINNYYFAEYQHDLFQKSELNLNTFYNGELPTSPKMKKEKLNYFRLENTSTATLLIVYIQHELE